MGPRAANIADPRYLHYTTPTERGNSGSPVLSTETWRVVGLHHKGFPENGADKLNGKSGVNYANEGIYIGSILAAARAHLSLYGPGQPGLMASPPAAPARTSWWTRSKN